MKKRPYVKDQTGSEIIRRGFMAAVFLMMLLRDLHDDNLYICVIYDVILFVGVFSCVYSIAGEFILNWRQRKKEEKDAVLQDPRFPPVGIYRDVWPIPVISETDRLLRRINALIDDETEEYNETVTGDDI